MKKSLFLVVSLLLLFVLAGCINFSSTTTENSTTTTTTVGTTTTEAMANATFEGVVDVVIGVGQEYSKLEGITAKDYDGTDLTDKIVVDGILNGRKPGEYEITYKVTGKNGVEVTAKRKITVVENAKFEGVENLPLGILVDTPLNIFDYVTAKDNDDTDITDQIVLTGDIVDENGDVDTSTPGDYQITLTVTGNSNYPTTYVYTLTVFSKSDARITFTGIDEGTTDVITKPLGTPINIYLIAQAKDYDGSSLEFTVTYDESYEEFIDENGVFNPDETGEYQFTYKTTGENGNEVTKVLTIKYILQGIILDGKYFPVLTEHINNDSKPSNAILIYTELKGKGEFGVLLIVDKYGKVIMIRDCYGEQIDVNNPIKAGDPANVQGLPNFKTYSQFTNGLWDNWTAGGADSFQGILGPQGTEGGIPEGGFAIYFSAGSAQGHAIRALGVEYGREYGLTVQVVNLDIPGFDPELGKDLPTFTGIDDIVLYAGDTFDPLAGVKAYDKDGNELTVSVVYNDVDTAKAVIAGAPRSINDAEGRAKFRQGWYAVVYEVTTEDGYKVHVTRRVTVQPKPADAQITGSDDVELIVGQEFDPLAGIVANDYDGTNITSQVIVEGEVDINTPGEYTFTYKVTGKNGVEVTVTRKVTVLANARFEGVQDFDVFVGKTFDPFALIKAYDYDNTDITSSIIVESEIYSDGTFDTSVVGSYEITLRVTGQNGVEVTVSFTLTVKEISDATLTFVNIQNDKLDFYVGGYLDLLELVIAKDYNGTILTPTLSFDEGIADLVVNNVFTPNEAGTYIFTFKVTGASGNEVTKSLTVEVYASGIIIDGVFLPVLPENVNNDAKPSNSILIYTELQGQGQYGVLVLVDKYGQVIMVRDCYGEQIDINNPIKAGDPANPQGLPNNKSYSTYTGGLWDSWVPGSQNDTFAGILGPQGTPGGIPEGGFAILFTAGSAQGHAIRALGVQYAREFGLKVEVIGLEIPNFDSSLGQVLPIITGVDDIELVEGATFDPLAGVKVVDKEGNELELEVEVVFNDVDTSKPVIPGATRNVSNAELRAKYRQGWYAVVYKVTTEEGHETFVTRRVTVRAA